MFREKHSKKSGLSGHSPFIQLGCSRLAVADLEQYRERLDSHVLCLFGDLYGSLSTYTMEGLCSGGSLSGIAASVVLLEASALAGSLDSTGFRRAERGG